MYTYIEVPREYNQTVQQIRNDHRSKDDAINTKLCHWMPQFLMKRQKVEMAHKC